MENKAANFFIAVIISNRQSVCPLSRLWPSGTYRLRSAAAEPQAAALATPDGGHIAGLVPTGNGLADDWYVRVLLGIHDISGLPVRMPSCLLPNLVHRCFVVREILLNRRQIERPQDTGVRLPREEKLKRFLD